MCAGWQAMWLLRLALLGEIGMGNAPQMWIFFKNIFDFLGGKNIFQNIDEKTPH